MIKQPLKQDCFGACLISTGATSKATRICFNLFCSLGLTPGGLSLDSVS